MPAWFANHAGIRYKITYTIFPLFVYLIFYSSFHLCEHTDT
jgi:hypothetical protein